MAVDVQKWFNEDFGTGLVRHADEARKVDFKFQINITGDGGGEWGVDPEARKVEHGHPGAAHLTITMDSSTFAKVHDNPRQALVQGFFAGHIKMTGATSAGETFADLLQLAKQQAQQRVDGHPGRQRTPAAPAPQSPLGPGSPPAGLHSGPHATPPSPPRSTRPRRAGTRRAPRACSCPPRASPRGLRPSPGRGRPGACVRCRRSRR